MALEDELNEALLGKVNRIPWVMRVMNGEHVSFDDISTDELIHGLTLMSIGLHENILRLARELDASR